MSCTAPVSIKYPSSIGLFAYAISNAYPPMSSVSGSYKKGRILSSPPQPATAISVRPAASMEAIAPTALESTPQNTKFISGLLSINVDTISAAFSTSISASCEPTNTASGICSVTYSTNASGLRWKASEVGSSSTRMCGVSSGLF